MALQDKAHWFVIVCCLAAFDADLAFAQAPSGGQAKAGASGKSGVETVRVCTRPKALAEIGQPRWSYDRTGRLVSRAVPDGLQMEFYFDAAAPPESVDKLPAPDKDRLRCPGDKRPVATASPPPPASILKLVSPDPQKKGALPENVKLFRSSAKSFGDPNPQKTNLVTKLLASIADENKPMAPVSPNDLSVQAAKELYSRFREEITTSMAHQRVVAPYNVQKSFTEFQTRTQWKRFPLIADRWVRASGVGTTDTTPTVILTLSVYEQVKASLDAQTGNAKTLAEAKAAYEKAYAGLPSWLKAIEPYFAAQAAAPQNGAATAPVAARATGTGE